MRRMRLVAACCALVAAVGTAGGIELPSTTVEGPGGTRWTVSGSDRIRGEFVDWFDAEAPGATHSHYNFFHNRLQLGLGMQAGEFDGFVQYQSTAIWELPGVAFGPGGGYFANVQREHPEGSWVRQGWVRARHEMLERHFALQIGRALYRDGGETTSKRPALDWLKKSRIAERLLGPFDYTAAGRSFDGVQVAVDDPTLNLTGFASRPTEGGFDVHAGQHMQGIDVAGLSATLKETAGLGDSEARLFWIYYADARPADGDVAVVDNRPATAHAADRDEIVVQTIGANAVHVRPLGPGLVDGLVWAAAQRGDWQALAHRSWAYSLEAGFQLPDALLAPWLRGGVTRTSGDDDPLDGDHGTFFQLLPTARLYAQFPFYNMMNNQDVFLQAILKPCAQLSIRPELHWLRATEARDLVYSGGGATKRKVFGFGGLPANGRHELAYLTDVSITYRPLSFLTLYGYYGHAFGQGIIRAASLARPANYGYVEATVSF